MKFAVTFSNIPDYQPVLAYLATQRFNLILQRPDQDLELLQNLPEPSTIVVFGDSWRSQLNHLVSQGHAVSVYCNGPIQDPVSYKCHPVQDLFSTLCTELVLPEPNNQFLRDLVQEKINLVASSECRLLYTAVYESSREKNVPQHELFQHFWNSSTLEELKALMHESALREEQRQSTAKELAQNHCTKIQCQLGTVALVVNPDCVNLIHAAVKEAHPEVTYSIVVKAAAGHTGKCDGSVKLQMGAEECSSKNLPSAQQWAATHFGGGGSPVQAGFTIPNYPEDLKAALQCDF